MRRDIHIEVAEDREPLYIQQKHSCCQIVNRPHESIRRGAFGVSSEETD